MTPAEALAYGRQVARRLCPTGGVWVDDVAAEAAWGAFTAPDGYERHVGWNRGIDELRRRTHHRRPDRPPNTVTDVAPLDGCPDLDALGCVDEPLFDLTEVVPPKVLARLSSRDRWVLVQIAAGRTGAEIAAAIGVSPVRVSQILRRVREGMAGQQGWVL